MRELNVAELFTWLLVGMFTAGRPQIVEVALTIGRSRASRLNQMRSRSFTLPIAGFGFLLLFLVTPFVRPALAQSDEAAPPDTKIGTSKLFVWPQSLSYNVNIDKGVFGETKHFNITNEGTVPLKVVVNSPSNPAYVIKSGAGTATIPGKVKGSKVAHLSTVDVEFIPNGPVKSASGTIGVISDATTGKNFAIVALKG